MVQTIKKYWNSEVQVNTLWYYVLLGAFILDVTLGVYQWIL